MLCFSNGDVKTAALTKFHEDVLSGVEGDLLEVLAHQHLDGGFVPVVRDVLAHEVRLRRNTHLVVAEDTTRRRRVAV